MCVRAVVSITHINDFDWPAGHRNHKISLIIARSLSNKLIIIRISIKNTLNVETLDVVCKKENRLDQIDKGIPLEERMARAESIETINSRSRRTNMTLNQVFLSSNSGTILLYLVVKLAGNLFQRSDKRLKV